MGQDDNSLSSKDMIKIGRSLSNHNKRSLPCQMIKNDPCQMVKHDHFPVKW